MFLRAGLVSLALLLASRLLGLVRESALAAAFGATGMGDVAVLMLALPDWVAGVLASGGLAYVLLPAWAAQSGGQRAASQRRVAHGLLLVGCVAAMALGLFHAQVLEFLAGGLSKELRQDASLALLWSATALPLALLAALWATRLQYERDFVGMYAANLVVNTMLIAALAVVVLPIAATASPVHVLGVGLLLATLARVVWLSWRQEPLRLEPADSEGSALPRASLWVWAIAASGLPLALPFAARSLASQQGEGALATFNYAWKLAELPLLLVVQLVATLALGPIAQALGRAGSRDAAVATIRRGFALAWTLGCASTAGLLVAAPAVAEILFGWGRMDADALQSIADWGRIAAWGLLPQSLAAIALAVLAAQQRMHGAVLAYGVALVALLGRGPADGGDLMFRMNLLQFAVAFACLAAVATSGLRRWLPLRALLAALGTLLAVRVAVDALGVPHGSAVQVGMGALAALAVLVVAGVASADLRAALRR